MAHFPSLPQQHWHLAGAGEATTPAGTAKIPWDAVTKPIQTASSIVTVLERRVDIGFYSGA
jgi:hypothetical protein